MNTYVYHYLIYIYIYTLSPYVQMIDWTVSQNIDGLDCGHVSKRDQSDRLYK